MNDELRATEGSASGHTGPRCSHVLPHVCVRAAGRGFLWHGAPRELFREQISRVASGINRGLHGSPPTPPGCPAVAVPLFFLVFSSPLLSFRRVSTLVSSFVPSWAGRGAAKESRRPPQKVPFIHCSDSGPAALLFFAFPRLIDGISRPSLPRTRRHLPPYKFDTLRPPPRSVILANTDARSGPLLFLLRILRPFPRFLVSLYFLAVSFTDSSRYRLLRSPLGRDGLRRIGLLVF